MSRTHVRKLSGTPAIFEMNYDSRIIDDSPIPALLVGKRYRVESDVAQCFPSIYTHAIDWAVLGKDCAKRNTGGSVCAWSHALDKLLQNCKNGETHGLLIGPHASNLVSELILTKVDEMLVEKGYRFVRHIDDYECYAHTHDEAEAFIRDLDFALGEYGLARNQAKTRIVALETCIGTEWVRTLQNWSLGTQRLERKTAAAFLDEAIRLAKANDDLAPLNYAFKMLASHAREFGMTRPAGTYFANVALHLMYLHPYLIPLAEGIVFGPCMVSITRIQAFAMLIYDQAMRERDHLTACYALYYATKYGFELPTADVELVLQHKDCLLLLFAWMYFGARGNDEAVKTLRKHALDIASALSKAERDLADAKSRGEKGEGLKGLEAKRKTATVEFDRYWLFAYETLPAADLTGEWKAAKRAGVSFIDRKTFEREQNAG